MNNWPREIVQYLYSNYSHSDVPLNTFFVQKLGVDESELLDATKISQTLNELQEHGYITWQHNSWDEKSVGVALGRSNYPVPTTTLKERNVGARLTIKGLDYVENLIRVERQDKLLSEQAYSTKNVNDSVIRTNRFTILSSIITLGALILSITSSLSDNTSEELVKLNAYFQSERSKSDSLVRYQREMNESLKRISNNVSVQASR